MIANAFYLTSDIERWGSGLKRIYDACKEADVKVEFENLKTGFLVTFYRPSINQKVKNKKKTQLVEGLVERLVEKLVESQKKILLFMKNNPFISKQSLAKKIGISTTAIDKNIVALKKKGLLRRIGPDKGGHWEIIDKK